MALATQSPEDGNDPKFGNAGDRLVPFTELLEQISRSRQGEMEEFVLDDTRPPRPLACQRGTPTPTTCELWEQTRGTTAPFRVASSQPRLFEPRLGYLKPQNLDMHAWDEERILLPQRAWPSQGAAGTRVRSHDHQRQGLQAWRPASASRHRGPACGPGYGFVFSPCAPLSAGGKQQHSDVHDAKVRSRPVSAATAKTTAGTTPSPRKGPAGGPHLSPPASRSSRPSSAACVRRRRPPAHPWARIQR